jgi:dTDP-4-dehydrorhamnose 3,5-epimerase
VIFSRCAVSGMYQIDVEPRVDERGSFARLWCAREFAEHGLLSRIVQINAQISPTAGTLRGLHYQLAPYQEVKVVRCSRGRVYDVVVDLRPESPTYRAWAAAELREADGRMLYVPEGCAHGYITLEASSEVVYLTSEFYSPAAAQGVRFDDPALGIEWPLAPVLVSQADRTWPLLEGTKA